METHLSNTADQYSFLYVFKKEVIWSVSDVFFLKWNFKLCLLIYAEKKYNFKFEKWTTPLIPLVHLHQTKSTLNIFNVSHFFSRSLCVSFCFIRHIWSVQFIYFNYNINMSENVLCKKDFIKFLIVLFYLSPFFCSLGLSKMCVCVWSLRFVRSKTRKHAKYFL